jgi:hypothetical protein
VEPLEQSGMQNRIRWHGRAFLGKMVRSEQCHVVRCRRTLLSELGNNARDKIVERACELYDGQRFVTEREEEDESQINVCECCGSRDIQVRAWVDGNTNEYISDIDDSDDDFWCDSCEEAHYFVSMKEYKERMYQWWKHLDLEENKRLSGDAEDLDAWWNSLSFDQQRELYKKNYWDEE